MQDACSAVIRKQAVGLGITGKEFPVRMLQIFKACDMASSWMSERCWRLVVHLAVLGFPIFNFFWSFLFP